MSELIDENGQVQDWFPYKRSQPSTTQVLTLDKDFQLVSYLSPISLQWIRRYYDFSEFMLTINAYEYRNTMQYVFRDDRRQLMIIQKIEYFDNVAEGQVIQLSGYSFEFVLNDRVVYPRVKKTMKIEEFAFWLFDNFKTEYPIVKGAIKGGSASITMQESNEELGSKLFDMLETQEMSWKIDFDMITNKLTFEVWQGLDRTQSQNKNPFVVFSSGFENIHDIIVNIDKSNFKNYAIVVGNGSYEDGNQIAIAIDRVQPGEIMHQLYVDATADNFDAESQTLDQFVQSLVQKGLEALDEHKFINELEFSADNNSFYYLKDYDLGDKCDIIIDEIGQSYETRIIEVYETIEQGVMSVELTFGEKTPTVYQKARLK